LVWSNLSHTSRVVDANQMLANANRSIFPVMVRDQARASITVEQNNGKWTATGFGDSKLARQISTATKSVTGTPMIVHVLPFNLYFVGSRSENRLMLTPLGDYSSFNLKTGATLSADEVFSALAPFARTITGCRCSVSRFESRGSPKSLPDCFRWAARRKT
jgi:hypothetical protein